MPRKRGSKLNRVTLSATVSFVGGEDLSILFANHVFVRSGPDGFLVSFAQSHGPYEVELTAERLAETGITAKIVARLLVPPNRMREFAGIFNTVLEQMESGTVESTQNEEL